MGVLSEKGLRILVDENSNMKQSKCNLTISPYATLIRSHLDCCEEVKVSYFKIY